VLRIYKGWMARHHALLLEAGQLAGLLAFDDLQPGNVAYGPFRSPATERGRGGGCSQQIETWMRTDIEYQLDCNDGVVRLPEYKQEAAIEFARRLGIPIPGFPAVREAPTPTVEGDGTTTPEASPEAETPTPAETPIPAETPTPAPAQTATPTAEGPPPDDDEEEDD
jgi:hypothetical protein